MSLNSAIEAVYDAFSDVQKPSAVEGCPCCMTADEYETLTSKPLRALTAKDLSEYASSVMLTIGSEDDFRYFLPRILELTIEDDVEWTPSPETIAVRIKMAGFTRWADTKQTAINRLWLAVVTDIAASESDPELLGFRSSYIETWLAAATLIPIPVSPLLDAIVGKPDIIRTIYNDNFMTLFKGRLNNAFLDMPNDGQTEITNWLRSRIEADKN